MKVIALDNQLPIKMWLGVKENGEIDVEDGALNQAHNLAKLPFAYKHIALMPDCHEGYGMPIGGVLATKGVVIPNAVGVDIGCGMCASMTSLTLGDVNKDDIKQAMGMIREAIPVGFEHHKEQQDDMIPLNDDIVDDMVKTQIRERYISNEQWESASKQLGTLGGGNHFIEIQADDWDNVWVMIHSGSRNLGKQVADFYNKAAVWHNEKWYSKVPKEHQLAFLPIEEDIAKRYMAEMQFCVDFAYANRMHMMGEIEEIFKMLFGATFDKAINIAHNYAAWENHFGQNVIVHRKGATRARKDELGIIPGSQGTSSYIVKGLGNQDSFMSCSHGAGRRMGRKDATRRLNLDEEIRRLDERGIIHGIRNVSDLDEAAGAYKDIDTVMELQKDLVEIVVSLRPLAVIKG